MTERASGEAGQWVGCGLVSLASTAIVVFAHAVFAQAVFAFADVEQTPGGVWEAERAVRLVVEVAPIALEGRGVDELPAELKIDFEATLTSLGLKGRPDLTTLRVVPLDAANRERTDNRRHLFGPGDADRPFRWYDDAIPYEFPDFHDAVNRHNEKIVRRPRTRGGFFHNALGTWTSGRLVFVHRQHAMAPSRYAVYFDLLKEGETPSRLPPAGWVGDGTPRCELESTSTTGSDHTRVELDDWNGDGLIDLLVGEQTGHLFVWLNRGTATKPVFTAGTFVEADGAPLDAGHTAAPKVVDWDGDGVRDLLVGTHWNRLLFFKNVGTNTDRKLVYRGPVRIDGKPLEVPIRPLERGSEAIFNRDYYPVPEIVDWDADGDADLLLGGYVTGRIYLYENTGRDADGMPKLRLTGPLEADGGAINVRYWGAAPCVADFDGDGDLDLITGNFPMYVRDDEPASEFDFLLYYENTGSREKPVLSRRSFPMTGERPRARLATPRAYDFDHDGDLDLVVSASRYIYLYENTGTKQAPRFAVHAKHIAVPWGLAPITVDRFVDWDRDGKVDLVRDYTIRLNAGEGNPYVWSKSVSVLPKGDWIAHPSKIGDDWFWPFLDDFDRDGKIDVLFGDWWGHIWLHRNESTPEKPRFDLKGERLGLVGGALLKVGPNPDEANRSFVALQGARTVFTVADFDRDGLRDLVVGDTFGKFRLFRNVGTVAAPRFAEPVPIGDLGIRGLVETTDWNGDGWPDVIGSANSVRLYLNQGPTKPGTFDAGTELKLPPVVQPRTLVGDINGDGDDDLHLGSTQGSCFVERSFLQHGYASTKILATAKRPR